ncbi:hypothetical protein FRC05_004611 [Tulasnella sp. 425]|nr:hypothetical protein FRC05_004611 [Tulasnella sp. 425]
MKCKTDATHKIDESGYSPATVIKTTNTQAALINEMTISIIVIQLGMHKEAKMVCQSILQGPRTIEKTLEALKTADQLIKSENMGSNATAMMAGRGKPKPRPTSDDKDRKFHCKIHGKNKSHNSIQCKKLYAKENAGNMADGEVQATLAAGVSQLPSPPLLRTTKQTSDTYWNADSGATSHMTSHREWLRNMQLCCIPIHLANNYIIYTVGKRSLIFNPLGNMCSIVMPHVLYVPELQNNLFSIVFAILDSKLRVEIENTSLLFKKDNETILIGSIKGKVAMLDGSTLENDEQAFITAISKDLLHRRLAHIGKGRHDRMISQNLANSITGEGGSIKDICDHCIAGKHPFLKLAENRATKILHRIHTNVHRPLTPTLSHFQY